MTSDPSTHRLWVLLLRAWRGLPWPGGRGRYRTKDLLLRGVDSPRSVPTRAGWLLLEPGSDSLEEHLLTTGDHWETAVVALLEANRPRLAGTTVLDVGGHVGFYALLLSDLVGPTGRVVAVEAHGELCERIRWARRRNDRPWLEVLHAAATDRDGRLALGADPDRGHTTVAGDGRHGTFDVRALRLDDWWRTQGLPPPRLVLMDIEGSEAAALRGLEPCLREAAPDLLVEVHPRQLTALGTGQEELIAWLRQVAPYELYVVDAAHGVVPLDRPPDVSSWHLLARHATQGLLTTPAPDRQEIPLSP